MRKILPKILLVWLPLLFLSTASFAQNVITGKVTDSKDGSAVSGATVTVKGTRTAVQTGSDGTYRISAPANATLVFTSVGFAAQERTVNGASVDVGLVQANQQLNEVVVVAYGTRRKGDLTGAVTSVSAKDFQKGNNSSAEQLLQGKVAGLQITSGGGSAGGGSKLRIRGTASLNASKDPLIVIDGIPVEGNGIAGNDNILATINPNDIESMSVLKDASATALYGSRASNGVIIITTKKGSKGKVRYNFNTQLSLGTVAKKVDVLSGDQIRAIINADALATGNNTFKNILGTANTDWQDGIYQSAFGDDNNLSASGAIGFLPFRASVGYSTQDGLLRTDKFNRLSSALNLSPKFFNDNLSVNLNLKASNVVRHKADGGAVGAAASFDPTQTNRPIDKAKFGDNFEWINGAGIPINTNGGSVQPNPYSLLDYKHDKATTNRFIGNIQLDYRLPFFPDLHAQVNLGIDRTNLVGDYIADSVLVSEYRPASRGKRSHYKEQKQNTLTDLSLFYTKELKQLKTKLDVLALHSYQDFYTNVYSLPSYANGKDTLIPEVITNPTKKPEYRLESYLGRVNLVVDNKYLLTASIRRDASSKFSESHRVSYFPAVAAAWKLKDEFFKSSNVVSDLKLRFGWGITGQQDGIDYYSNLPRYYGSSNGGAQYQFGDSFYSYSRPSAYDPNLKWETTTTSNLGLDFGFLNNRISGSVDFYIKKTKDLLSVVPVASGGNFDVQLLTNVGDLENKGVEFTLNTMPVRTANLTWEFGFNMGYNKTEITKLLAQQDANFKGVPTSSVNDTKVGRHFVGYAPYSFYVSKQVYDPATGKPIEGLYEDLNRDGVVDDKDVYFYKKPAADVTFGINTQLTYKKYTLGITGHGALGNYLYNQYNAINGVLRAIENPLNFIGNASADYLNTGFSNTRYISDYYIQNASFFRLDNINLGYNFGKVLRNKASLRIGASIQNVFVITKYTGVDPENSSDEGLDNTIYPRPRTYSLNLNLDF
jgi:TonB-dependent starch-binding outer membrane protein SusC